MEFTNPPCEEAPFDIGGTPDVKFLRKRRLKQFTEHRDSMRCWCGPRIAVMGKELGSPWAVIHRSGPKGDYDY